MRICGITVMRNVFLMPPGGQMRINSMDMPLNVA
jgi:hypothetical protein